MLRFTQKQFGWTACWLIYSLVCFTIISFPFQTGLLTLKSIQYILGTVCNHRLRLSSQHCRSYQEVRLYILLFSYCPILSCSVSNILNRVALYAWYYVAWATGNIIGPQTFRANQAPAYTGGTISMIVCYIVAIFTILTYGYLCHRENKQREADIQNGLVTADGQDWLDLTDKQNRSFKYTT
jgi:MFS transporter, ACS family, allantoate permease